MTYPGLGGQQPPPQNAAPAAQLVPGVQPGTTAVFTQLRAGNTIINSTGVFTYSGTPAAGNLIASQAPSSGTDSFGNNYLQGVASYGPATAIVMDGGFLEFYTGSRLGGWSTAAEIATDPGQDMLLTANGQITANGNPIG